MPPIDPKKPLADLGKLEKISLELNEANATIKTLAAELGNAKKSLAGKDLEIEQARATISRLTVEISGLKDRLGKPDVASPKMRFEDFAKTLRGAVEKLNGEIRPELGGMRIDSMEVELKSGVDISDGVKLTQLESAALSPESVSTFRFTLHPAVSIKISE